MSTSEFYVTLATATDNILVGYHVFYTDFKVLTTFDYLKESCRTDCDIRINKVTVHITEHKKFAFYYALAEIVKYLIEQQQPHGRFCFNGGEQGLFYIDGNSCLIKLYSKARLEFMNEQFRYACIIRGTFLDSTPPPVYDRRLSPPSMMEIWRTKDVEKLWPISEKRKMEEEFTKRKILGMWREAAEASFKVF